ncbi:hypothetical protein [Mycobacterium triplex]|uniref:Aminoglycoside phosphotransferase n=1 Tax=Mycobacterium triplex TaxID=47839 RepID=A0A024JXK7_9MYCO|nr:hypothetical protein [Mycobacterium triplex]CDO87983.1 aminoglycoside phosphotransferase [Mycobacterium triplex]
MVDANDEFMHHPGPHRVWQESFFFSWFDAGADATGLARIGYRPSDHTADALLYTMRNGRVEGGYARLNARFTGTPDPGRLRIGALEFHMSEPMSKWRILLRGRDEVDLTFTALHAPYDFRAEAPPGQYIPPGIADVHMEQSGRVTGTIRMNGATYEIDGLGQRDKSWGDRDWRTIEGWNWIPMLFGPDFTMNCTLLINGGRAYPCGYIHHDGANHAVRELAVDYENGRPSCAEYVADHGHRRQRPAARDSRQRNRPIMLVPKGFGDPRVGGTLCNDRRRSAPQRCWPDRARVARRATRAATGAASPARCGADGHAMMIRHPPGGAELALSGHRVAAVRAFHLPRLCAPQTQAMSPSRGADP